MNINPNMGIHSQIDRFDMDLKSEQVENVDDKELMDVCKDFESVFVYMMMKEMKNSVMDGGLVEKSQGSKMFEDMYLDELSKEVTKGDSGIGLAKMMYEQLKNENRMILK